MLGDVLGKGGFATVYRALDLTSGKTVAIKEIERNIISPEQLPKILNEAELLKSLSHDNIIKFLDCIESKKHIHFAIEYVEGGSLYHTVKKFGTFPESLLSIYVRQVLQGLDYLHQKGVLHRDIKGANLLLDKTGRVKLADFGTCTYASLNKNITVIGTPFWSDFILHYFRNQNSFITIFFLIYKKWLQR